MCATGCDYYSCFPVCSIRTIVIICIISAFLCYSRNAALQPISFEPVRILTFSIIKFITITYINVTNNRLNIAGQNCCISKHIFSHILRICNFISLSPLNTWLPSSNTKPLMLLSLICALSNISWISLS